MANWSEGSLKIRGTAKDIVNTLRNMFDDKANVIIDFDNEHGLVFQSNGFNYIKGTDRGFVGSCYSENSELRYPDDIHIVEVGAVNFAWAATPEDLINISKLSNTDVKFFGFEAGMHFTQVIEVAKGKVILNETSKYEDYH